MFFISKFKEKLPYPPISSFPQSKIKLYNCLKKNFYNKMIKFAVQLKKKRSKSKVNCLKI